MIDWNSAQYLMFQNERTQPALRPYLNVLTDEKKKAFEQDIFDRVKKEYPIQKNGNVIFRFPRFFFVAISMG